MWRAVRQNWSLKLLSVVIGTGLWMYVEGTTNPLVTRHLSRPVKVTNVPEGLVTLEVRPATVTVVVRARQEELNALREAEVQAEVDVGRLGRTEGTVGVDVLGLPRHVELEAVTPSRVRVLLDVVTKEERAVEVRTRGEPPQGLEVVGWQIYPPKATVEGPAKAVHDVRRIVGRVDVTSLTETKDFVVKLEALNLAGQPVEGATVDPPVATATINLRRVTVKNVAVTPSLGPPPEGYRIAKVSVEPRVIAVTGAAAALKGLDTVETETVALEGETGAVRSAVRLRLPQGVRALGSGSVVVNVRLEAAEQPAVVSPPAASPTESPEAAPGEPTVPGSGPAAPTEPGGTASPEEGQPAETNTEASGPTSLPAPPSSGAGEHPEPALQ